MIENIIIVVIFLIIIFSYVFTYLKIEKYLFLLGKLILKIFTFGKYPPQNVSDIRYQDIAHLGAAFIMVILILIIILINNTIFTF
jgi:hypothetical protein